MSTIRNKVFRDSKNGGQLIDVPRSVKNIIDTTPLQRLGEIKQMGVAHRIFRGATHSRLAHSIGVFGIANYIFDDLKLKSDQYVEMTIPALGMQEIDKSDFTIAALLHDVGHSPYSHALESVLLPNGVLNHEQCTIKIIDEYESLNKEIRNCADVEAISNYLRGLHPNKALETLISGEFDCDRVDYLVRDSESCGVKYGLYDFEWLTHSLSIKWADGKPSLILDVSRGFEALKVFLLARKNMHKQVYYHHTIRAVEINLRAIFRRINDIRDSNSLKDELPRALNFLVTSSGRPSISEFVDIDDATIYYLIKHLSRHANDEALRLLCNMFIGRTTVSCIYDSTRPFYKFPQYYRSEPIYIDDGEVQPNLFGHTPTLGDLLSEIRTKCSQLLSRHGLPPELARYLVTHDRPPLFSAGLPTNFLCEIGGNVMPLIEAEREFGFGASLLASERLVIDRIYVPRMFETDLAAILYGNHYA